MHSKTYVTIMNSRRWRELRASWLTEHPLCEVCEARGIVRAARCIHHRTPIESGRTDAECMTLAFTPSNLQSLCYECHAMVHKAARSNSRESHEQRDRERMERWKERHTARAPRGTDFSEGVSRHPNPLPPSSVDEEKK